MKIKSILDGDQTLSEALKAIPFIEELAEADYGKISLNKFVEIMESNGFEAEKLRNSLQQAAKLLIANNNDQPKDFFGISLNDWKLFIGEQAVEDIIAELSTLNDDIELVAGGTSTSHHGKTIAKTVGIAVGTAGVAYGIKKAVQNKNTLEKAIEVQAKVEAGTFIEKTDIPQELKAGWEQAKRKVAREASNAGETLETAARREFSDAFFEAGGIKGIASNEIARIGSLSAIVSFGDEGKRQLYNEAKNKVKNALESELNKFTENRFGMKFTIREAEKQLGIEAKKQASKVLSSDFPKLDNITDAEIEKVGETAAKDLVESSVKTLFDNFPLNDYFKGNVERYILGENGRTDLLTTILRGKIGNFATTVSEQLGSIIDAIKPEIEKEIRSAAQLDLKKKIEQNAKENLLSDYKKGDLNQIIQDPDIQILSTQYSIVSDPEQIATDLLGNPGIVLRNAATEIQTNLGKELGGAINSRVKEVAFQKLEQAKNTELSRIALKVKTDFEARVKSFLKSDEVQELAKEEGIIKGDFIDRTKVVAGRIENDLTNIKPGKIIESDV